jgi:hypothetical protein
VLKITKAAAEDAIERFSLGAANRLLAGHWLSLWQGDDLPHYEQFNLAGFGPFIPNMLLFDVLPERRVTVRKAGSDVCTVLHRNLEGVDWVTLASLRYRNMFMRNFAAVAGGAAMRGRRILTMTDGSSRIDEELVLPFAPRADGICPVLGYVDWKMDRHLTLTSISEIPNVAGDKILPFRKKGKACG